MNIKFEPKKRFQSDPARVKSHQDLVVSEDFQAALEAAMNHMQTSLLSTESSAMAINGALMQGAKMFVNVLLNLAETQTTSEPSQPRPLNPV